MEIERHKEQRQEQRTKKAAEVFQKCPRCESKNVFAFENEVFCLYCGWDSVALSAECQFGVSSLKQKSKTLRHS